MRVRAVSIDGSSSHSKLMATLPTDQRNQAIQYDEMVDPAMPPDRLDPGDERHLAGAFRDNRVIPFEGACASAMPAAAGALLLDLVEEFVALLPDGPRRLRLREIEANLDETWVSWIGGWLAGDVFYARVPVPRYPVRDRPPLRRVPRLRHAPAVPYPHRDAHTSWQ